MGMVVAGRKEVSIARHFQLCLQTVNSIVTRCGLPYSTRPASPGKSATLKACRSTESCCILFRPFPAHQGRRNERIKPVVSTLCAFQLRTLVADRRGMMEFFLLAFNNETAVPSSCDAENAPPQLAQPSTSKQPPSLPVTTPAYLASRSLPVAKGKPCATAAIIDNARSQLWLHKLRNIKSL